MEFQTKKLICMVLLMCAVNPLWSSQLKVNNASFEFPVVDVNSFQALPYVDQWIETDNDTEMSTNTGVFPNPASGGFGHLAGAHGQQLAFLGSEQGNAFEQVLEAVYEPGRAYQMTVSVGVSSLFPPSQLNELQFAFYYVDGNDVVDITTQYLDTSGVLSTMLVDACVALPTVSANHAWAGQPIGIAIRAVGPASGFWDLDHVRVEDFVSVPLEVQNASFENPVVDPAMFPALPFAGSWIELDHDTEASSNTGVFPNSPSETPGHLLYADANQLAFLGSEAGNGFEQDLGAMYRPGYAYELTVGVGVSAMFSPLPENGLALVLYYLDQNEPVEVASQIVSAADYVSWELRDVTLSVSPVGPNDLWAYQDLGVAIRSVGPASGFWDLDHVRVNELLPHVSGIENPSFESPVLDVNTMGVLPWVEGWIEHDLDMDVNGLTDTGIFLNGAEFAPGFIQQAQTSQLAYLGTQPGAALVQDLAVVYEPGSVYRLTVGVAVSDALALTPETTLELALYYDDANEPVDLASIKIPASNLSSTQLKDVSLHVPVLSEDHVCIGQAVGVVIRAKDSGQGFWILDDVRLSRGRVVE